MGIETEYGDFRTRSARCERDGHLVPGRQRLPLGHGGEGAHGPAGTSRRRTRCGTRAGFDLSRDTADASQLTDEDLGLANVILTNGARLYVDHAHPEYSGPECTEPLAAVLWDKAGERVMEEAAAQAARCPGTAPIQLYKNNTDNKGASYGCHENYLMNRVDAVRRDRQAPDAVLRHQAGRLRRRPGRPRRRRPGRRLPDQPARRLLRGRGRPGDHAEAADHQHQGRAARRPGEVPQAARDHRRRQHERAVDLPQARHRPRWCCR